MATTVTDGQRLNAEVYSERRQKVEGALAEEAIDALLASHLTNARYLCGFTGSAGYLMLRGGHQATLYVDGRYGEQATAEASSVLVEVTRRDVLGAVLERMTESKGWTERVRAIKVTEVGCEVLTQSDHDLHTL